MPWGLAAAAVSAGVSAYGSSQAAKGQQNAADSAQNLQQTQYDTTRSDLAPYRESGTNALGVLNNLATTYGKMPTAADVTSTPGYQFGMDQGASALQNGAAAGSGIYSGALGKALERYGSDYGTTKYQQSFNNIQTDQNANWARESGLANMGLGATNSTNQAGQTMANNVGQIGMTNATNQGAADISQANTWGNLINQAGSYASGNGGAGGTMSPGSTPYTGSMSMAQPWSIRSLWGNSGGVTDPSSMNAQNGSDVGMKWADGGPVRTEPVVGTRTPLPAGGTGGGLSNNALLQLLIARRMGQQPTVQPPTFMPMQAAANPGAVLAARLQAAGIDPAGPAASAPAYAQGGAVHGPGGPTSDSIPVPMDGGGVGHLSNNEHVFTAQSVAGAGNGDVEKGHMVLNKLMQLLQQHGAACHV